MRFERESYRKLYVAESAEHRLLPLAIRGIRDYLIRHPSEDGTLLPSSTDPVTDMVRFLGALPSERKLVSQALTELQRVGFLKLEPTGRLWITRYEEAQAARSAGAIRQQRHRDNKRQQRDAGSDVTGDEVGDVTSNVTSNRPNRRDETQQTPKPPAGDSGLPTRPVFTPTLLEAPITAKSWEISDLFRGYATNCGLSELQYADVVTDFREKITRATTPTRLASLLFRFIEQRALNNRLKSAEKSQTKTVEYENPPGEAPDIRAWRIANEGAAQ